MRALPPLVAFLMLVALIAGAGVLAAPHNAEAQPGPPGGPGPHNGPGGPGDNETGNETGNDSRGPPAHANANERARERAQAQVNASEGNPQAAWARSIRDAGDAPGLQERAGQLERLPLEVGQGMGILAYEDGRFEGRFVSFTPGENWIALEDVTVNDVVIFEAVYFPHEENVTVRHAGNAIFIQGSDWRFHIVDAPAAPLTMRAGSDPIQVVLPEHAAQESTNYGRLISYPTGDGLGVPARWVGPVEADPDYPELLLVNGSQQVNVHLSAQRLVLAGVANQHRAELDEALTKRALGGEVTMLQDLQDPKGAFSDVVLYEEMDIHVAAGEGVGEVPENATAHSIVVSARDLPGKTVVVNMESGLVDAENMALRYYNVLEDEFHQVPMQQAASLAAVLDPSADQETPRYWIVEGVDGLQLLISIPHFSTHVIEVLSFEEAVIVVSVIAGMVGAAFLVSAGTAMLFRKPREEEFE